MHIITNKINLILAGVSTIILKKEKHYRTDNRHKRMNVARIDNIKHVDNRIVADGYQ